MKDIFHQVETNIKKCELLWQEFSPDNSLFDLWNFWLVFYSAYQHEPYFIVLRENNKNVGLLPLWREKEYKRYFWFGGLWQEGISFWVKNPVYIPMLLSLCPRQTFLKGILVQDEDIEKIKEFVYQQEKIDFGADEPEYILNIKNFKSFDDYLAGLKKERRKSIKKDLFCIEKQNPEIIFDNFDDLKYLVSLNEKRTKAEFVEGSPWYHPGWKDARQIKSFLNLIQNPQKKYQLRMTTVKINQKIAGVDLAVIFKQCYYALAGGYDIDNFSGIGSYFNMLNIKDALNLGLERINALQGDYGWKHRWYQTVPLYYFSKE